MEEEKLMEQGVENLSDDSLLPDCQTDEIVRIEISEAELPTYIRDQFTELENYRNKVEDSEDKAKKARNRAKEIADKKVGFFNKGDLIEGLQDVSVDLAEAQMTASDAQKTSFEYQTKLAKLMKVLFGIGVSNLAMNRSVVRELELKLQDASQEELDELTYNEIMSIIRQLKSEEDLMIKQENLTKRVATLEDKSDDNRSRIEAQANEGKKECERIKTLERENKNKERQIDKLLDADANKNGRLSKLEAEDKNKSSSIRKLETADKSKEKRIKDLEAANKLYEKRILQLESADRLNEPRVTKLENADESKEIRLTNIETGNEAIWEKLAENDIINKTENELISSNSGKITVLENECANLREQLQEAFSRIDEYEAQIRSIEENYATNKSVIVAYIVGVLGLLLALVQFII